MTLQFLGSELRLSENTSDSRFQIIPCGLEKTVSYGTGTALGAGAILAASQQLERIVDGREPCLRGMFTHSPLDCTSQIAVVLADLRSRVSAIARASQVPVVLGGEHSLSYGVVMGIYDILRARGETLGIVQIDAHADFRDSYQGEPHSHASVMYLLAQEGIPICSLGVRQLAREEDIARVAHGVISYDADVLVRGNISSVTLPDAFPSNIYVSFDVDGLDSSIMAATGTPVPGGLGFYQALDLVRSCLVGRACVGLDVVELAPIENRRDFDFTTALIAHALMSFA